MASYAIKNLRDIKRQIKLYGDDYMSIAEKDKHLLFTLEGLPFGGLAHNLLRKGDYAIKPRFAFINEGPLFTLDPVKVVDNYNEMEYETKSGKLGSTLGSIFIKRNNGSLLVGRYIFGEALDNSRSYSGYPDDIIEKESIKQYFSRHEIDIDKIKNPEPQNLESALSS